MRLKDLLKIIDNETDIVITAKDSMCEVEATPNDKLVLALKELEVEEIKSSYSSAGYAIEIVLKENSSEQPYLCMREG